MSPIRIDFYLLASHDSTCRGLALCRLLEKAYFKGYITFVFCQQKQEAADLDALLWTFKEDSFIAHGRQEEPLDFLPPILISEQQPQHAYDLLINLTSNIPPFYRQAKRVIELVANEEKAKENSRKKYLQYRREGGLLHTHQLK